MIDQHAINASRAIVSTFETYPPRATPGYAQLALLKDGPNAALQVTFGAHQATDRANSLDAILRRYRDLAREKFGDQWEEETLADELEAYLPALAENTGASTSRLAKDKTFTGLLVRSAADSLMQRAQNEIFDEGYMKPALEAVNGSGWQHPLSLAVVYDSLIHGSWAKLRDRVDPAGEEVWISNYITLRRVNMEQAGPGGHSIWSNRLLRNTTYRMDTFRALIRANNWELAAPFMAHGVTITENEINAWS